MHRPWRKSATLVYTFEDKFNNDALVLKLQWRDTKDNVGEVFWWIILSTNYLKSTSSHKILKYAYVIVQPYWRSVEKYGENTSFEE